MAPDDLHGRTVLLDACCLINLFASGRVDEIVSVLPCRFLVPAAVTEEALFVLPADRADVEASEPDAASVHSLIQTGLVGVVGPESDEEEAAYVEFAAALDDGEAMTCALAVLRAWDVATDERKAIRILTDRAPHVTIHTTASLVKAWADLTATPSDTVRLTLENIQSRGRFRPGRQEPLRAWWESLLRET